MLNSWNMLIRQVGGDFKLYPVNKTIIEKTPYFLNSIISFTIFIS